MIDLLLRIRIRYATWRLLRAWDRYHDFDTFRENLRRVQLLRFKRK